MSQFRVLVGVKLDTKSLSTLRQQINNIKGMKVKLDASLDNKSLSTLRQRINQTKGLRVQVDAKLDPKSLSVLRQRINQTKGLRVQVGVRLDTKGLTALRNQINKIKPKAIKLNIDTSGSKNKVNTVVKQINQLKSGKVRLNLDTTNAKQKINAIRNQIKSLSNVKVNLKLNVQNNQINQAKQNVQSLKGVADKGIYFKFNTGTFANEVNKIRNAFNALPAASSKATASVKNLKSAYSNLTSAMKAYNPNDAASIQRAISAYDNYTAALKRAKNQLDMIKRNAVDPFSKMKLNNQIDEWMAKNTRAAREFKTEINRLKAALNSCNNAADFKRIGQDFNNLKTQVVAANKAGLTFGDTLRKQFSKYAAYMGISSAFMMVTQGIRYMFNAVKEVDSAMTELYRVSDLSADQYSTLFDNMTESAKQYGVTLSNVIQSTSKWVKQGFDANTANALAEVSVQYQHIGDIDQTEADENLITAYNGFKEQLLNTFSGDEVAAVGYAADIFNELGNNYAIEAGQVGDALTRCASALNLAGNTIQESAG